MEDTNSNNCVDGIPCLEKRCMEVMANDVTKNSEKETEFETYVKSKGYPRLAFLDPQHPFHWYYLNCKERFKAERRAMAATGNLSCSNCRGTEDENNVSSDAGSGHTSPLSATGIPIANDSSIQSPHTTVSAEQDPRIEEVWITKTDLLNACDILARAFDAVIATFQVMLESDSKDKAAIKLSSAISVEVVKKEEIEISQSDDESVPSPSHVQLDSEETYEENDAAISTGSSSFGHLLFNELENEVQSRLLSSKNQDRQNGTIGSNHEKKRTEKRLLSCSSIESSHSDTPTASSSTPSKKRTSK